MVNFKSIKVKLLGIIVPLLTIGMLSISLIGYFYSENIITNEIQSKMNYQIAYITEGIEKRLLKHEQLANTLARSVEACSERATDESYINMIRNVTATNKDTFGSGIWFEAYKFDEGEKYFGPYAYKDNDSIAITMEYSNEEYNYFEYDWYKNATDATDISVWSDPYYDETSNITMITTSVPFFDDNNKLKGVVSADIDLNSIQDLIKETKVGETGWAFLLNTDGMYIANRDVEKVMQENILDEPNKSLAEIGKVILETKEGEQTYLEADGKYQLYYSQIPKTKWIIGVSISQKELYSQLKGLLQSMIIALIVVLFIITMGIVLYANSLSDKMKKIQDIAESLAHGNFTVMSDIVSNDEIGGLSNSFNQMIGNIKALLKDTIQASEEVSNSATNLAATSEETSASFEEISRTIEDIFHGAEDQSIHAEKSVIIASSLDEKFGELQQNSNIMYENADEVYTANKSGVLVVEELIQKTDANNESMTRIEIAIEELNTKSNNINSILETISSIAGQTNLLALNASIEAARAGEAGIGFAVVADEIRKLAEASDYATDKIKKIVEELQNESDNTVEVMKEVKVITQEQTNAVAEVNKTFYKISKSIETIYNEIENTNNFISLITEDKDNIVSSIENISAVSEETTVASQGVTSTIQEQTAAIEEVAKSAELLNELSVALNQQINKFKI